MQKDLTEGSITGTMLRFALPMILGNLLQQCYNVADTLIVGRFLGADALAAVGSAYTLMTFLTSILLGLCMGSGAVFSLRFGEKNSARLKISIYVSFVMIAAVALAVNLAVVVFTDPIMSLLCVPEEIYGMMREYLRVIFSGILAVLCLSSAGCGKFSGAADFSGNFSRFKYHTGSGICPGASPGRSGSGRGHGYFPVCFRYWNRYLYACKNA